MKKIEIIFAGLVALILIALLVPLPKAHAVLPLGSPLAGVVNCASSASCATPAYMAGGETVIGHATLATGTVTITGLPFTSSTSYSCSWSDQTTAANGLGTLAYVSASSITITSNITTGNTDAVSYQCSGN